MPAIHLERHDANLAPGAPRPDATVQWVRLEARPERYAAFLRGDIDLLWDSIPGAAEALPRLSQAGLEARIVMWTAMDRGIVNGLIYRAPSGVTPTGVEAAELAVRLMVAPDFTPGSWAAVEPFSASHLEVIGEIAALEITASEKWDRFESIRFVNSPAEALELYRQGQVVVAGVEAQAPRQAVRRWGYGRFRYIGGSVLIAHPRLLERGPGSLSALLARWVPRPPRFHHDRAPGPFVPDASYQHPFFTGAAEAWLEAAGSAWVQAGLMPKALPAGPWLDGRYVPRVRALPGSLPWDAPAAPLRWRVPVGGSGLH